MPNNPRTEEEFVSLETLAQGGAIELFNEELSSALANILDPNTKPTTVRSVSLKVDITPNDNRSSGIVSVKVSSKLAPPRGTSTVMFFGKKNGVAVATERNPNQMTFDEIKGGPVSINDGRK